MGHAKIAETQRMLGISKRRKVYLRLAVLEAGVRPLAA